MRDTFYSDPILVSMIIVLFPVDNKTLCFKTEDKQRHGYPNNLKNIWLFISRFVFMRVIFQISKKFVLKQVHFKTEILCVA